MKLDQIKETEQPTLPQSLADHFRFYLDDLKDGSGAGKVNIIKWIRNKYGLGLVESLHVVDAVLNKLKKDSTTPSKIKLILTCRDSDIAMQQQLNGGIDRSKHNLDSLLATASRIDNLPHNGKPTPTKNREMVVRMAYAQFLKTAQRVIKTYR